jgi:hypothetical protein
MKKMTLILTLIFGFSILSCLNDDDNKTAKFTLEEIELVKSRGFNASELKEMRKLVDENVELFKNKWNEYFNN